MFSLNYSMLHCIIGFVYSVANCVDMALRVLALMLSEFVSCCWLLFWGGECATLYVQSVPVSTRHTIAVHHEPFAIQTFVWPFSVDQGIVYETWISVQVDCPISIIRSWDSC
jgi:hypothetical protein